MHSISRLAVGRRIQAGVVYLRHHLHNSGIDRSLNKVEWKICNSKFSAPQYYSKMKLATAVPYMRLVSVMSSEPRDGLAISLHTVILFHFILLSLCLSAQRHSACREKFSSQFIWRCFWRWLNVAIVDKPARHHVVFSMCAICFRLHSTDECARMSRISWC